MTCFTRQVIMTESWAWQYPEVHFACMHPGWADTPAVRTSMPAFYNKVGVTSIYRQYESDTK